MGDNWKPNIKVGFIGAGNMAKAISEGMTRNGIKNLKFMYVA